MGSLIVIVFLAFSIWTLVALFRRLWRQHAGVGLWFAVAVLVAAGAAAGVWCAFYCEYDIGASYRVGSFPIPVVLFHLEEGHWVDFPVPKIQAWSAVVANVASLTALATLPIWLALWLRKRDRVA